MADISTAQVAHVVNNTSDLDSHLPRRIALQPAQVITDFLKDFKTFALELQKNGFDMESQELKALWAAINKAVRN